MRRLFLLTLIFCRFAQGSSGAIGVVEPRVEDTRYERISPQEAWARQRCLVVLAPSAEKTHATCAKLPGEDACKAHPSCGWQSRRQECWGKGKAECERVLMSLCPVEFVPYLPAGEPGRLYRCDPESPGKIVREAQ